ncbi:DUF3566 domain-containing protein [Dermatophilus congolensis]|uniref:DUF3566 domain-containing protein n=1 Tax=Dermatophilus congolensis TaxID=1863 RepID=UPI001FB8BFA3|nr:DUF3566 domain-containing protein [Dermatophilus congolensis]
MSNPKGQANGPATAPRTMTVGGVRVGARPAGRIGPTAAPGDADPRRVKLTLARVDPISVMRISFLLSVAFGIAMVIVVIALWLMLNSMGVFAEINAAVESLHLQQGGEADARFNLVEFLSLGRVLSLTIVFGVVDVILLTAIATVVAFIYNMCAALVGGAQVTLVDD